MTSHERVLRALAFDPPDRVPLFDGYWAEFVSAWREAKGFDDSASIEDHYGVDIHIAVGDETLAPTRAEIIEETGSHTIRRDGWGRVIRTVPGGFFYEELEGALPDKSRLDSLHFDPPDLEARYTSLDARMPRLKERFCVFAKTGGPFIRTEFVRGEEQFLMDLAADPVFARELAMRVAHHLAAIGVEELRRWGLHDTGVWVYDDMASNDNPMFSPRTAEQVLAPAWKHLVDAYKGAGARFVVLHSDGNIGPLLDLFIDLGFDGINPVEPKAGLDALALRERYGSRLALLGGLDNAFILPGGDPDRVREHVLRVLAAGDGGGLVLGTHSIGPDISVETYDSVISLLREYGTYPLQGAC